jgi:mono/diheme cytochrome c family protein
MFGTPAAPHFPELGEDFTGLVSLENLKMAAGAVSSDKSGTPQGLYREHCASCHGISGDGYGPSAQLLNPYPRDFRLGKFKFKRTSLNSPPTDEDLTRILRNGIPGTAMPSFRTLPTNEIEALVDYVKYLAIRGQVERKLIEMITDLDDSERLLDLNYDDAGTGKLQDVGQVTDQSNKNKIKDQSKKNNDQENSKVEMDDLREGQLDAILNEIAGKDQMSVFDIFSAWMEAEDAVVEIPDRPAEFAANHPQHNAFVKKGRELFFGKANCVQCHGNTGLGDGGQVNFDDWTSDWIKDTGVNYREPESYEEFSQLGALKPRPLRPRNLRLGVFRGGDEPEDIFHRVKVGISGTPMPAASFSTDELWAIVAYLLNMPYEKTESESVGGR